MRSPTYRCDEILFEFLYILLIIINFLLLNLCRHRVVNSYKHKGK